MDETDSIITDFSLMGSPRPFKELPKSPEISLHLQSDDLTSSSSDAVIRALKTLQEKIKKLEQERLQAENKFGDLEKETNQYKRLIKENKENKENKEQMFRLEPTITSSPADKPANTREQDIARCGEELQAAPPPAAALYCPSQSHPYATYVRPTKKTDGSADKESAQRVHDSRVSILEKQLEYMRRLVSNAEQERIKATDKISSIEQQKSEQIGKATETELERQNKKISELEQECGKLGKAHTSAEGKISELQSKLLSEKENHHKLIQQTEELARVTEENKNLMLSMTPSLPPSPTAPPPEKSKKRKKRPSVPPAPVPTDWKTIPFVCGRSAYPSHSLAANVQQMLSALKQSENPTGRGSVCARITTHRTKKSSGNVGKEIKQVISGLEDDLGSLTFEYQKLCSSEDTNESRRKLAHISQQMDNKTSQIKKLKSCLKKLESEERVVRAQAVPSSGRPQSSGRPHSTGRPQSSGRPLSTVSNREVQISVKGRDRRELLSKVKNIRDVITNKDLQWV